MQSFQQILHVVTTLPLIAWYQLYQLIMMAHWINPGWPSDIIDHALKMCTAVASTWTSCVHN